MKRISAVRVNLSFPVPHLWVKRRMIYMVRYTHGCIVCFTVFRLSSNTCVCLTRPNRFGCWYAMGTREPYYWSPWQECIQSSAICSDWFIWRPIWYETVQVSSLLSPEKLLFWILSISIKFKTYLPLSSIPISESSKRKSQINHLINRLNNLLYRMFQLLHSQAIRLRLRWRMHPPQKVHLQ